jgi:hypothetical protein
MKLLVQEYLETNSFGDLVREHGVYASFSKSGHKFSLNYDQIEAKEADPLAQECRGLILSATDGSVFPGIHGVDGKIDRLHVVPGVTQVLAYPMKRFFNHGQGSAAEINWHDPKLAVLEKLDGCFTYDTELSCWDGSVIKIGEVVKKKLKPTLIGKDKNGNLFPCEVLDWFDNGTKNNWLEIETNLKCRGKNRKFLVTSNHGLFLNGEFKPAFTAKINDNLFTWHNELDYETLHFVESSLLGDATISKNGRDFKFEEGHKIEHLQYCDFIKDCLGESYSHSSEYISGFGSKIFRVSSKPNISISRLRKKWYKKGIKKIPQSLDWMTDFSVAKWLMDDGSLSHNDNQKDRAHFATNGFSKNEVIRLGKQLHKMYGVDYAVYFSKGWNLRVNAGRNNEIAKMWQHISPYVVPCMRYKLPQEYRNVVFNKFPSGKILKKLHEVQITNIKIIETNIKDNRKNFPHGRKGYDIKTSCGNYIANGVLVHNSLCIMYYDKFIKSWCVATRSVPEADLFMDNGIFTFRTLFEKAAEDTMGFHFEQLCAELFEDHTYCWELTTPYNRIVVYYPNNKITLLAARNMNTLEEVDPKNAPSTTELPIVQVHTYSTIDELVNWVSSLNPMEHEGVVVRDGNFNRIKVKNAAYVAASKIRDSLSSSPRNCLELILLGKDDDAASFLPQEIQANLVSLKEKFVLWLKEQESLAQTIIEEARSIAPDKKTFALTVQKHKPDVPASLFAIYDGKANSIKSFIDNNRKEGTWSRSFIDKILSVI